MSIDEQIEQKLTSELNIAHLELVNESHMHSGPRTDTHYKVIMASDDFETKRLIQRHQMIYKILDDLMQNPIHALSMHLFTLAEWDEKSKTVPESPKCLGGSKKEA